jgi:hypothetical protein
MSNAGTDADTLRIGLVLCLGINSYTRTAVTGLKLAKAMSVITMKTTNVATCVIANGGSDCVGANAFRVGTFMKL